MSYTNYLPDELLLEVLGYIVPWQIQDRQSALVHFCGVNRQWYDIGIRRLYEWPYLSGKAYELFVRTVCPSVLAHIKPSSLSGLVRILDLSHIVHNSNKATTARLLGRTKSSLEVFVAPQASFAINCWASLSKCTRLRVLDLSLVSECISFPSLNQTMRQLPDLRQVYLPRCSSNYDTQPNTSSSSSNTTTSIRWPPLLEHLSLSGSVNGQFLADMVRQPSTFPPAIESLSVLHCPGLDHIGVRSILCNLSTSLTTVELRDLPAVKHGRFNAVMDWLPHLTTLSIALDYIDTRFGNVPLLWAPYRWPDAKPLQSLTLVSSGQTGIDPARSFTAVDLYALIDDKFLGRLRFLNIAQSTEWAVEQEGAEIGALELLLEELDKENWEMRRWHYWDLPPLDKDVTYEKWVNETEVGRRMRPRLRMLKTR